MKNGIRSFLAIAKHLGTAILHPTKVGSLFPSTRYVARAIIRELPKGHAHLVEFGPGTGAITGKLLEALPLQGTLTALELNTAFKPSLDRFHDPRFTVLFQDVLTALPEIKRKHPQGVDAVVSGIPFSLIPIPIREKIVAATAEVLRPGGRFVVYQSTRLLVPLFREHFAEVKVAYEVRNVFPYFIITGTRS
jgi:phosphatidylethanolamine/phosphatidyl-N-methylethanolamine N-methyltransferase